MKAYLPLVILVFFTVDMFAQSQTSRLGPAHNIYAEAWGVTQNYSVNYELNVPLVADDIRLYGSIGGSSYMRHGGNLGTYRTYLVPMGVGLRYNLPISKLPRHFLGAGFHQVYGTSSGLGEGGSIGYSALKFDYLYQPFTHGIMLGLSGSYFLGQDLRYGVDWSPWYPGISIGYSF